MPYSDLIMQESEYTYSANIQFDIENDRKLLRFIPNDTTTALLKEYFTDITRQNPENHARILYGSYGTGKSHFLTVLSLLLSKSHTDGFAFETFTDRLSRYDAGLAADIASFVHNHARKPFLVVPIVFDFEDFDRCIYFSLKKKLDSLDIPVQFKTFYDQATQLIEQWKSAADSKKRLEEACNAAKIKLPTLEAQLHRYDKRAEKRFQRLFSVMTYGVTYVYEISNLSEAIKQANMAISKEYCGIVFIFDEFGRYIEDNIKSVKVKSIQDLAEICDHTEGNNHVILVSHKEISQYTQRYGKNISNEWKKVEGRYKATPINDKQDQCLSLISSILTKNPDLWRVFEGQFRAELNQIYSEAIGFQAPQTGVVLGENPYEGGFPLHPISLFALDKLSKKVAQNERTFFTYLASKEEHSLYQFLESHELEEFHFVGIDSIYDYFEPNIKAVQSDSSYEWYRNLQHALAKNNSNEFDDSPETRILKVIAAIGIINDSSLLVADKRTILSVIDAPNEQLEAALKGLCNRKIIKYSGAYKRYDFFEASIFDVEELIKEGTRQVQDKAVIDTLNEHFIDFVLYPNRYNREYKINRIFLPVFATNEELTRKTLTSRFGDYYDGILAIVLANEDVDLQEIALQSSCVERGLVVVHKDTGALVYAVKQYIAIQYLYSKKEEFNSKDPAFEKELQYYADEITVVIKNMVGTWNSSFEEDTFIYYNGVKQEDIHSISDLSDLASRILYEAYPQTLIVNNELINKNAVSGSIMAAKRNVLNGMIRGELPGQYYGVQTLSPDYLAVRSVLVKNGFVETDEAVDENELNNGFQPQREVNAVITRYINAAREGAIDVSELYRELKQTPYGLRDGYLSILFARFLVPHKRSLIITSHGVEQELTAELFEELVRRPKDYSFTIASWSKEQLDYFDALAELFSDFINPAALGKNRVKAIYDGMLLHFKNISKFSRTTNKYVSDNASEYRKLMSKTTTNYSEFLISTLGRLGDSLDDSLNIIKDVKFELENVLQHISGIIANQVNQIFGFSESSSLGVMLTTKYKEDWERKRQKSFDYYTNAFLDLASGVAKDESDFQVIGKLSKALTGLELSYWNDSHYDELIKRLTEIKEKLDSYKGKDALNGSETRMILQAASGEEKSVVFDRNELNNLSKTVKNKILSTFGNYGLSITYDDKVQIVLSVLEDLLEGK